MNIKIKGKPYERCRYCGANLDPGEECGCRGNAKAGGGSRKGSRKGGRDEDDGKA